MEADISIWRKTGHFYFALTSTHINTHQHTASTHSTRTVTGEPGRRVRRETTVLCPRLRYTVRTILVVSPGTTP